MALKYGANTITTLKYGANNITTGKYGNTVVFSFTPKMQDQITNIQSYISGSNWYFKWKCVSGFTSSYTVKFSGTMYSVSGISYIVNTTNTYTGSTTEQTYTYNVGGYARNFVGTVTFSCQGYTDYTHSTSPKADLSNYITFVEEGFDYDYDCYYFDVNCSLNISYSVETDLELYDTDHSVTYEANQYSYSGSGIKEVVVATTGTGYDPYWIGGTITMSAEGFNDWVYYVDYQE